VGTGFKDEDLSKFTELLTPLVIQSCKKPLNYNVGDPLEPDDWFESSTVWELQAADLSKSSVHKGGIGKIESGKGIGLRFPRFIRVRDDKKPEGATTAEQIVEMYNSQAEVGAVNDGDDDDEELL
jgi:DNA ligase-1